MFLIVELDRCRHISRKRGVIFTQLFSFLLELLRLKLNDCIHLTKMNNLNQWKCGHRLD